MRYDHTYLMKYCEENNVKLCDEYHNINIFTIINGICKNEDCENTFSKSFRSLVKTNGYCIKCAKMIGNEKAKIVCIEKYGVDNPLKSEEVKNKIKKTCIDRYGVEFSSQAKEIKEKVKQTNLEKYGTTCTLHNSEINEKTKQTWLNKYGVESPNQSNEIKEKKKQSYIKKYNVEHPSQSEEIKNKKRETCKSNFGVEFPSQSKLILDKIKNNNLEKYGVEHTLQVKEFRDKGKQTCIKKYGVEHISQSEEYKEKVKQTCLEKYGVEHPFQFQDIMEKASKNAFKLKEYIFPSGRIGKVQGTEPYALNELIKNENINEDDIFVGAKNVPTIWYFDNENKKHRHYVDIYIKSQNRCIECKSTWTLQNHLNDVFKKQSAAKDLGYKYEIWVYDKKGNRVEIIL